MNWKTKQKIKKICVTNELFCKIACIFKPGLVTLKAQGMYDYFEKNGKILEMLDSRVFRPSRKKANSVQDYENNTFTLIQRPVSKSYIAEVNNASFIGETDGFFINNMYVADRIEWDKGGMNNYLPPALFALCEKRCLYNSKYVSNDLIIDSGILLLKMWSVNIYHLTFEVITRLVMLDKYYNDKKIPIIVDEIVKKDERSLKLLEIANVNNREIIWVKANERINIKKAIIPPVLAWGTYDQKVLNKEGHGWILDEQSSKLLKELILKKYDYKRSYDKVYVARGNNDRLVNESYLIEKLKSAGFEIFYPDKATFEDEVDCFSTANCLVTCAGAAITNILYCKNDVKLFQICPYEFQCATGAPIEDVLDIQIRKIAATLIKKGQAMNLSTFMIEDSDIEMIIQESKL